MSAMADRSVREWAPSFERLSVKPVLGTEVRFTLSLSKGEAARGSEPADA